MRVILIIIFNVLLTNVFCALPMSPDNLGILQLKQEVEAKSLLQVEASQEQAAASQGFEKKIIITEDLGTYSSIKHLKKISPELLKDFSSDKIPYFGHRLFKKLNLELSKLSLETSNIPDDYTIGVGDRFSIHVWNQTQDQIVPVSVNSLGVIKFPLAGEIFVKGVLKSQLRSYLLKNLSKFYKTLNLSFEFIKLRQLPVYVTGEVRSPGVYMANAMSTPLQLIIGAGGPTLEGSLRSIELINGSKTLATIDFYKYLLTGKLKRKLFLKAGNSLHIPLASKTIAVLGQVKRPGIFELKAWEKLSHLLSYAGGVLSDANTSSLQLIRFVTDGRAQLRDINFSKNKKFTLSDGDVLLVHPRLEEIQNRVQISGNIYRPGIYEWTKKLDLLTLIERAQGLKKET
ncbi:SLBB domain-containing protein, partial [bacterium]|nr:SLBB domain-containing protein [bacterium]